MRAVASPEKSTASQTRAKGLAALYREEDKHTVLRLVLQGLVYAKYHMTDPAVFYNQEDLWAAGGQLWPAEGNHSRRLVRKAIAR